MPPPAPFRSPLDVLDLNRDQLIHATPAVAGDRALVKLMRLHPLPWRLGTATTTAQARIMDANHNTIGRLSAGPGVDASDVIMLLLAALGEVSDPANDLAPPELRHGT